MIMGTIVNLQRYSLGDGPGIRTTVFLKGCPLKCLWCSNPESQDPKPEVAHRESLCRHCGKCLERCSTGALSVRDGKICRDVQKCVRCGACVEACLYKSMTWYGEEMSADDVVREVRKDEMFFGSEGGVTLSGGEILMQPEFAAEILRKCKEAGIHTAIETSGCGARFELLFPWLDLILFDIKCVDSARHRELTGVPSEPIHENLRKAAESGIHTIVRYPFIPGYNASEAQIRDTAELMRSCGLHEINLMPYHSFGIAKYDALGRPYTVTAEKPTQESMDEAIRIFASYGIDCSVSGHTAAPATEPDKREPRCEDAMLKMQ